MNVYLCYVELFDATKETLIITLRDIPFLPFFYGFADFKGPADHRFIQYFSAVYMDFVCFKVRIIELNLTVRFHWE